MTEKKNNSVPDYEHARVLVIGDVMLDQYITGGVQRISPEAPVPVVHVENTHFQPGGAGNVAINLAALGVQTTLLGLVGKDKHAATLRKLLDNYTVDGILFESTSPTITKVRVISRAQQLLRLDYEETFDLPSAEEKKLISSINELAPFHDVIILSDYAKGTLSEKVCKKVIQAAAKKGIPVITDPKSTDWTKYAGSYVITPNFGEFSSMFEKKVKNDNAAISRAGKKLIPESGSQYILVTRSEKGMSLVTPDTTHHWTARAKEVFDVSGAGDTVIATLSASLACGVPIEQAVELANIAAGIVVTKFGTASVNKEELTESSTN